MLRNVTTLRADVVLARDGDMGFIADVYFDDERWNVRYFVVDVSHMLRERRVLIAPDSVLPDQPSDDLLRLRLTRSEVQDSPQADTRLPVALQFDVPERRHRSDPHLRSSEFVIGYHVHALDGAAGRVSNLVVDDATWTIASMVVSTGNGFSGRRVLIAPRAVQRIDWPWRKVHVNLTREQVRGAGRA